MKRLSVIFFCCSLSATTLVYNLRIRRSFTGLSSFLKLKKRIKYVVTTLPVFYHRKARFIIDRTNTDIQDHRIGGGTIFNFRIPTRHWWVEATTAIQKESLQARGTTNVDASQAGFDDIVFSGGYNFFPTKDHQITLYGLAGFPTNRNLDQVDAQVPLVGTRFFSLGGGTEYSYSYINTPRNLLAGIFQLRVIHFFTREAGALLGEGSKLQPGQTIDLLFSLRFRHKRTVVETGYNPTFLINASVILPEQEFPAERLTRHGGYINILHLTKRGIGNALFAVGGGLNYNTTKLLHAKGVTAFLNFTVAF